MLRTHAPAIAHSHSHRSVHSAMADTDALFGSDSDGEAPAGALAQPAGAASAGAAAGDAGDAPAPPADAPPPASAGEPAGDVLTDADAMRAAFGTDSDSDGEGAGGANPRPALRSPPPRDEPAAAAMGPPIRLAAPLVPHPPHPEAFRLVRLSHLVGIETRPFKAGTFEAEQAEARAASGAADAGEGGGAAGGSGAAAAPATTTAPDSTYVGGLGDVLAAKARAGGVAAHTLRWRRAPGGGLESNARWVEWSDGSVQLHLGDGSAFDVRPASVAGEHLYLYAQHRAVLQGLAPLETRLAFTPAAGGAGGRRRGPAADRAAAAAAAALEPPTTGPAALKIGGGVGGGRAARVKPVATVTDPARAKAERERAEADAARARDGLGRRQARARAAGSGGGGGGGWAAGRSGRPSRYSAAFLEALDEADGLEGSGEDEEGEEGEDGLTAADRARAELARGGGGAGARVAAAAAAARAHRAGRGGGRDAALDEPDAEDAAFIVDDEDEAALAADTGQARAPDEDEEDAPGRAPKKSKRAGKVALSDDDE